jgi:hypothetical protein
MFAVMVWAHFACYGKVHPELAYDGSDTSGLEKPPSGWDRRCGMPRYSLLVRARPVVEPIRTIPPVFDGPFPSLVGSFVTTVPTWVFISKNNRLLQLSWAEPMLRPVSQPTRIPAPPHIRTATGAFHDAEMSSYLYEPATQTAKATTFLSPVWRLIPPDR